MNPKDNAESGNPVLLKRMVMRLYYQWLWKRYGHPSNKPGPAKVAPWDCNCCVGPKEACWNCGGYNTGENEAA